MIKSVNIIVWFKYMFMRLTSICLFCNYFMSMFVYSCVNVCSNCHICTGICFHVPGIYCAYLISGQPHWFKWYTLTHADTRSTHLLENGNVLVSVLCNDNLIKNLDLYCRIFIRMWIFRSINNDNITVSKTKFNVN